MDLTAEYLVPSRNLPDRRMAVIHVTSIMTIMAEALFSKFLYFSVWADCRFLIIIIYLAQHRTAICSALLGEHKLYVFGRMCDAGLASEII